jgi:antitoxin component of RelBE/YafQ-DinJ toxin-antitoxin module
MGPGKSARSGEKESKRRDPAICGMMMVRIATEKALPFEPLIPNAETIEAIKSARRGKLTKVGQADHLLESLNADD